jgi:hypothetical protein
VGRVVDFENFSRFSEGYLGREGAFVGENRERGGSGNYSLRTIYKA